MRIPLRILVVEKAEIDSMLQLKAFSSNGCHQLYKRVDSMEELITALPDEPWDIVIVDSGVLPSTELAITKLIQESGVRLPCLILSERTNGRRRIKMLKFGIEEGLATDSLAEFIPLIGDWAHDPLLKNLSEVANRAIRDQKEWFRVTLSSIGDAVITTDTQNTVTFMNPVAERITGYSLEEAVGKPISRVFRIFNEITMEPAEIPVERVLQEGFIVGLANHTGLITKNGETRSISDSAAPIRSDDGSIIGVVMVFRDITENKELEKQMTRLDKLNLVGQMAAGIAHEIRNPMTTVHGFLQLIKINDDFGQYEEYFDLMIDELERANSIISGFLSLARAKVPEISRENLNHIIESVSPLIQAEAVMESKLVQLELGDIPDLQLNPDDIRQMILNLSRNALEASSPKDRVIIRTTCQETHVVLSVEDEGKGIEPSILGKLGTPFVTTKEDGTGLGLVICYKVADQHGASIKVESGSEGTTFSVWFKAQSK